LLNLPWTDFPARIEHAVQICGNMRIPPPLLVEIRRADILACYVRLSCDWHFVPRRSE
jgi:hypothetical protein